MTTVTTIEEVRKTILVDVSPETAFRVFTEELASWWPLHTHSLFGDRAKDAVVEPHAGGRVVEHSKSGEEAVWGEVLAYEPPTRFAMTWDITKDRGAATEVDVQFTAEGSGTRVELTHRGWEKLRERAEESRASYDPGWDHVLGLYQTAMSKK